MPASFTDDLRLAHLLADDADASSTSRFRALDLRVDTKPDLTPVTDADRAVEEVVVGVVSAPALNRRWWAVKDGGAWSGKSVQKASPCRVSDISRLEDASLSYASLGGWEQRGRLQDFLALARQCWRTRAYGDFWSYVLVAEGAVDLAAEPELALHDMAALDVIVREAGGRFTSLSGQEGPTGGNALASNGILHDAALSFLGSMP